MTQSQESRSICYTRLRRKTFLTPFPISTAGKWTGWGRKINVTRLIRKEVCSGCIKSIRQTLHRPYQHQPNFSQSALSEEVGLAGVAPVKGKKKKKKPCLLTYTGSVYSAITAKSTNLCHPLPTPQRWQAGAHLKAHKKCKTPRKVIKSLLKSRRSGQKHRRVEAQRLFNLRCYARKNDIPSLLMHTLYKQHNVTHSSEGARHRGREKEPGPAI